MGLGSAGFALEVFLTTLFGRLLSAGTLLVSAGVCHAVLRRHVLIVTANVDASGSCKVLKCGRCYQQHHHRLQNIGMCVGATRTVFNCHLDVSPLQGEAAATADDAADVCATRGGCCFCCCAFVCRAVCLCAEQGLKAPGIDDRVGPCWTALL